MADWREKIGWIREKRSIASIARESGIPYRIVRDTSAGRDPPAEFLPNLQGFYKAESYKRMRSVGVPTKEATALRGGALEHVIYAERTINEKVNQWTTGAYLKKFGEMPKLNVFGERTSWYNDIKEKIKNSLSRSQRTVKEIDDKNIS